MRAIAFEVRPVKPSVVGGFVGAVAMDSFSFDISEMNTARDRNETIGAARRAR